MLNGFSEQPEVEGQMPKKKKNTIKKKMSVFKNYSISNISISKVMKYTINTKDKFTLRMRSN